MAPVRGPIEIIQHIQCYFYSFNEWGLGMEWGSEVEIERHRRIMVSIWAFGYEFYDKSLVPDAVFDEECSNIDKQMSTGHKVLDRFFRDDFSTDTGMWIYSHPHLLDIEQLYLRYFRNRDDEV